VAIASLVVGLASVVLFFLFLPALAALILAVVAGRRIKRSAGAKTGRALAGIGAGLGVLSILLGVVVVAALARSHLFEGHFTTYAGLRTGDCFDEPSGIIRLYRRLPCTHAHDRQVVGAVVDPAAADANYPETTALIAEGNGRCPSITSTFASGPVNPSYSSSFLYPGQPRWDNGERRIICVVKRADGSKLTGSIQPSPST
jgi:hypothetical protein